MSASTWTNNVLLWRALAATTRVIKRFSKARAVLPREPVSEKKSAYRFVDVLNVRCKGGDGGDGMKAFTSLPSKQWAGPDGGDGGNGGHIIAVASNNVSSLAHLKPVISGRNGADGAAKSCHGKCAHHTTIEVPVGTFVKDRRTGMVLVELSALGQSALLARGGAGGHGNQFYLTNELRAPVTTEEGGKGEEKELVLEMRLMAQFGLIGFPNAGKSTLLTALSRAKPKIADYPFTTLHPHIGVMEYPDQLQISVADLPGLIEGSHLNRGLGIAFLRHIEKCRCLLYVIDLAHEDPLCQLQQLQYELEMYMENLSKRPHAILANKIDLPGAASAFDKLKSQVSLPVVAISAKERLYIDELKLHMRQLYERFGTADW